MTATTRKPQTYVYDEYGHRVNVSVDNAKTIVRLFDELAEKAATADALALTFGHVPVNVAFSEAARLFEMAAQQATSYNTAYYDRLARAFADASLMM